MISLTVNGKPRTLEGETPLPRFLRTLGIDLRLIAVAVNGEVIPKNQYHGIVLRKGDEVEIVRMVGGGAPSKREAGGGKRDAAHHPRPAQTGGRPAATRDPPRRAAVRPQPATQGGADVVVVGGGIIGCAIAYELSRHGVSCLLLESRQVGMAATNAAAGILAPLAEFQRPGALVYLGLASLRRYPAWVQRLREDVPDVDVEFALSGVLRVALDEEELAELRGGLRYQAELGVELIELESALVREVEPRLTANVAGGLLCPEEGQVSNQLFTLALSRAAQKRGVRVMEGCPAVGFRRRDGRVTAVRTPRGEFACAQAVLAAGPWTGPLARRLSIDLPIRPVRGQMIAFGRMVTPIQRVLWGARGYLVPRANGIVFAGATVEQVGFRLRTTRRGLAQVRRAAWELVPQLRHAREHFTWAGLRPGSPDGLPVLGPLPGWENVTVATGHFRNGILLAPITGELIARALIDGRPGEACLPDRQALAPFDPARFAAG